ncbi:hypothetical protein Bpfe_003766, partial [Biomphalaria pfeifferi]
MLVFSKQSADPLCDIDLLIEIYGHWSAKEMWDSIAHSTGIVSTGDKTQPNTYK